jgi:hypothetical protein
MSPPMTPQGALRFLTLPLDAKKKVDVMRALLPTLIAPPPPREYSDDLSALADAARYSRREDIARSALIAHRRRFAATWRANDAAFLLGRLEETAKRLGLALAWYERCLTESPSGTYTSEALGRKMTLIERLYGRGRARPIAQEYLRRFGNGTYAAAARALTRAA